MFSTPVVGADETVYAGSADTWFYALGRGGRLRWRYKTGEIIDSAGVLGAGHGHASARATSTSTGCAPTRAR